MATRFSRFHLTYFSKLLEKDNKLELIKKVDTQQILYPIILGKLLFSSSHSRVTNKFWFYEPIEAETNVSLNITFVDECMQKNNEKS